MILFEICEPIFSRQFVHCAYRSVHLSNCTGYFSNSTGHFSTYLRWFHQTYSTRSLYSSHKISMPTKQATLGYVNPSQKTLSSFVGQLGDKKSLNRQSKLSFSTKQPNGPSSAGSNEVSEVKVKTELRNSSQNQDESLPDVSCSRVKEEERRPLVDVKTEVPSSQSATYAMADHSHQSRDSSPQRSRKRSSTESTDSDDEPPSKKRRGLHKKGQKGDGAKKSRKDRKLANGEPASEDADNAQRSTSKRKKGTKTIQKADKPTSTSADAEVLNDAITANATRTGNKDEESTGQSSILEAEELDADSGDEKPEAVAKAREKVQTTIKSGSKDPYPDWTKGDPVPYAALCTTFSKIEMTTKRLEIIAHSSLFLRQVLRLTPNDLLTTILLMINKLAADYAGIELGIGESLIMKAIGETTGRSLSVIKADQNEIGDLGLVAAKSKSNQKLMFKPKPLTVRTVHEGLLAIATIEGQGAQGRKVAGIKKLLCAADIELAGQGSKGVDISKDKGGPSEAKYIVRTLEGKLRLGLADRTVLVALAQAMIFHEASLKGDQVPTSTQIAEGETILKSVYSELPSYEVIVPAMLKHGIMNLRENCKLQPGVPLKPMLAKPTKSITEVLDQFEGKDFTCEYKYDGERAQIHFVAHNSPVQYRSDEVTAASKSERGISNIFSRNSEDLSKKYPDILAKLATWVKPEVKSFVLDCETVAWDITEKKVLPFQQLMTRKRKDVKAEDITVRVCVFAFDLLFLNGKAIVSQPFRERRDLLRSSFSEVEGEFAFAKYGNTNQLDEIQYLLEESVKASCEGLMVKKLDGVESHYEPSRRSQNWLKVKKDYLSGVGDSLDLVVLGAYYGKGKRTSVYGAFLLACYNTATQTFETVCNIGTGFSDVILEQLHAQLSSPDNVIDRPKPFYAHSTGNKDQPDVWFEPRFVWEVKTADLTLSPRYRAAANQLALFGSGGGGGGGGSGGSSSNNVNTGNAGGKGISLRFPRFIKQREDKKPEEATTSRSIAEIYQKQESVTKSKGPAVDDDFEY